VTARSDSDCVIVDTNVLAVAQGLHQGASDTCRAHCTQLVSRIQQGRHVVAVDGEGSGDAILSEYLQTLRKTHSSGIGSKLAITLWRRRHDPAVCRKVDITPCDTPPGSFDEVPEQLKNIDIDDHKWIAVAVAAGNNPKIYQAHESEWWNRSRDFVESGIEVVFLCATDLMELV
jgi:hypothetical protein